MFEVSNSIKVARRTPMAAFQTILDLSGQRLGPTYKGLYSIAKNGDWKHPNPIRGEKWI